MNIKQNILYVWGTAFFVLISSCNQPEYDTFITGGGEGYAEVGDSTFAFQDTIVNSSGGNIEVDNTSVINYNGLPKYTFGINVNTNPGFVGSYNLGKWISGSFAQMFTATTKYYYSYYTDSTHTGVFTINSYNPQFQIISGTFHFTAVLYDSGKYQYPSDTISVSNGVFTAHIYTYTVQVH